MGAVTARSTARVISLLLNASGRQAVSFAVWIADVHMTHVLKTAKLVGITHKQHTDPQRKVAASFKLLSLAVLGQAFLTSCIPNLLHQSITLTSPLLTLSCSNVGQLRMVPFLQVNPVTFAHSPEEYFIAIGLQPTKPFAELKPELQDVPSDWSHPDESRSEEGQAELSSSSGHLREQPQGQMPTASQEPQAQRWLSLKPRSAENDQGTRRDMDTDSGTDKQQPQPGKQRSGRPGQPQTASSRPPSHGPIGSPVAKMVPLSSLEPKACAPQGSAQRATPMGAASFPVGGTTGTVGRGWPGQFGAMPSQSGSGVNTGESKGTKRAGGDGESKGKKRQRRSVQEKSTDGEGNLSN